MKEFLQKVLTKILYGSKDASYVSDVDHAIIEFDKINPKRSDSQKAEIKKHRNIFNR